MSVNADGTEQVRHGRAPWFGPEDLDDDGKVLYEALLGGPRARARGRSLTNADGRFEGPFNAMFLTPRPGNALQALGAAVRYDTGIGARAREIAILEVARDNTSDFEWLAHAEVGRGVGLTEEEITALLHGEAIPSLSAEEAAVREVVRTLLSVRDLDDAAFESARAALGETELMELIILVGYYNLLAMSMRVWRVPLHEDAEPVF